MVDVTGALKKIQIEAIDRDSAVSEGFMRDLAANINQIIDSLKTAGHVGDYAHSSLTEPQFQAERDTTWELAAGQSAAGTDWETLTGLSNVPDCRGEVLRGLDNGRGVDTARVLSSSQLGQNESHNHSITYDIEDTFGTGGGSTADSVLSGTPYPGTSGPDRIEWDLDAYEMSTQGGTEPRMRNVAGNIFIKVNR